MVTIDDYMKNVEAAIERRAHRKRDKANAKKKAIVEAHRAALAGAQRVRESLESRSATTGTKPGVAKKRRGRPPGKTSPTSGGDDAK